MDPQPKCVFVIGPESSGSMLIARIIAHVLGARPYGAWDAVGWSIADQPRGVASDEAVARAREEGRSLVCHRSLPYGQVDRYPDLDAWLAWVAGAFRPLFVLTTRDVTIVDLSKKTRFGRTAEELRRNRERSREIVASVLAREVPSFIWSYETFMYLGAAYLDLLYRFLDVRSTFVPPDLADGNRKYVAPPRGGRA